MRTNLRRLAFGLALTALSAGAIACGGDDNNGVPNDVDAGGDVATVHADSGPHPGTDSSTPDSSPAPDSSIPSGDDGGADSSDSSNSSDSSDGAIGTMDFSVFVKDLIDNHTKSTEQPTPIPPDTQFTDNKDLADYPASYFP